MNRVSLVVAVCALSACDAKSESTVGPQASVVVSAVSSAPLPLDLPRTSGGGPVEPVFSVEVDASGAITVEGKSHDPASLTALAKEAVANKSDVRAVIRADKSSRHGRVIEVLDALKLGGITKIAFGVVPVSASAQPPTGSIFDSR